MSNEIEKLPRLIERAVAALAKATTAAEILEVRDHANVAYDAAKSALRMNKIKNAHSTVLQACHKVMGDALVIEATAQCRLADEVDAAQERGELNKNGRPKKTIPDENSFSAEDAGLSTKQVHEARIVRDAEKAKPGVVRKTVDDKLAAGSEPTRSDVRRATKAIAKPPGKKGERNKTGERPHKTNAAKQQEAASLFLDKKQTREQVCAATGLGEHEVQLAVERERGRREALVNPVVDRSELSLTAQQKLDAALRQYQRQLDLTFQTRIAEDVRRRIDEIVLPKWKKQIEEAKRIYDRRRGIMDKATFNAIRRGLHPDSRQSISDNKLGEAFDAFMALEKFLLDEKNSPTEHPDLPDNLAAWDKMRKSSRAKKSNGNAVRPRHT